MNVNAVVDPGGFLWLQWKPPFWQNFVQFGPLSARVGRRVNCAYAFWVWLSIPARNVLFSTTEFKIVFVYTLHASKLLRVHAQLPLQLAQMVHSITTIPCFEVWLKPPFFKPGSATGTDYGRLYRAWWTCGGGCRGCESCVPWVPLYSECRDV